ncbi:MAG: serine/threonine-protein phosphatase, partial [Flavobacteriales bacterium]|nr:serine/threonine-protein phosphatase [Flavobacteriales bacterium]
GHGVPGAMVSVVCSYALSNCLLEEKITDPGKILDRTRDLVVERFERGDEDVRDGMDIALCALNNDTGILYYSGANNPVWIVKEKGEEVIEIKGNKQPIGKYDVNKPFTTHEIKLEKGDTLYLCSDGYPDQFGGEKGKKLKTTNLKKILISINAESLDQQRITLNEEFNRWKGDLEQVDDVCIIGVRIT